MKITKDSIYFITLFCSIIVAKPLKDNLSTKLGNRKDGDKYKILIAMRRQDYSCDYLYEDCESEEFEYKEIIINKKPKEKEKQKLNYHNSKIEEMEKKPMETNDIKKEFKDSLEDFISLDDIDPFDKNYTTPPAQEMQHKRKPTTLSTVIWFYSGTKPAVDLPPEIMLCNDESKCRLPFLLHKG